MSCIKDVPTLQGDNYNEWRKKVDLAFVCAEVDWVVDTPQPVKPTEPVKMQKILMLLGRKRRGIMLLRRCHIPSKTKSGSPPTKSAWLS